jgi:hypothetical protein
MHYSYYTRSSHITPEDLQALEYEASKSPKIKLQEIEYEGKKYQSSPLYRKRLETLVGKEKAEQLFQNQGKPI